MTQKTTYYHPDGSVSLEKTLIVTGTNLEVRVQQLERENAVLREKDADWENAVLHARDHRCDEAHCTCVVPLLGKINQLERENVELADFVERHEDALRLLRMWAAKPMHATNCDDLREETLAYLKTQ